MRGEEGDLRCASSSRTNILALLTLLLTLLDLHEGRGGRLELRLEFAHDFVRVPRRVRDEQVHQHAAYVSIRQHTSAYVSKRQRGIRQHTSAYVRFRARPPPRSRCALLLYCRGPPTCCSKAVKQLAKSAKQVKSVAQRASVVKKSVKLLKDVCVRTYADVC